MVDLAWWQTWLDDEGGFFLQVWCLVCGYDRRIFYVLRGGRLVSRVRVLDDLYIF